MDSKKLEILMTAVNLGSFSKASEVVGYTQSGLTHLINGLEREIGMALIRRDHSGISLTENGEALLPAIRDYLSATAKLENQIAAITQKKAETIRVAAYASLA
ncbi:MAG: LysR family transcriptional regulator, partial [Oscillospiraceae bacterium]